MRYFVSDIHGEMGLLLQLLDRIGFGPADELFVCGDMLDKGPHSVTLLKFIFSHPNIHCIQGNHEWQFLQYYHSLLRASPTDFDGVLTALRAYFQTDGHLLDWDTVDALEALPYYIEESDFICVHAGAPLSPDGHLLPLHTATPQQLVNDRRFKDPAVLPANAPCIFFGHTPTAYLCGRNEILIYPRRPSRAPAQITDLYKVHLDTGTFLGGVLGCYCAEDGTACYVQKKGPKT